MNPDGLKSPLSIQAQSTAKYLNSGWMDPEMGRDCSAFLNYGSGHECLQNFRSVSVQSFSLK